MSRYDWLGVALLIIAYVWMVMTPGGILERYGLTKYEFGETVATETMRQKLDRLALEECLRRL